MDRPNIVVIMTDQQRADLVAREGCPLDTMPFCDALARRGQWFERAYTPCPACVPARVSLLTGRFGSATRIRCNHHDACVADADLVTLMRAAGYRTALAGKNHSHLPDAHFGEAETYWHCRSSCAKDDQDRAFEAYLSRSAHYLYRQPTPFPLERQFPHRIVDHAIRWVDGGGPEPFFLWLSFPEPHSPYQVPVPYHDLFPPDNLPPLLAGPEALEALPFPWRWCRDSFRMAFPDCDATLARARSNYFGMLRLLDDQIRRFVTHLEQRGLSDNTLLLVTSDHGDFAGEYGLMRKGPGVPEVLTRIPLIACGPGVAPRSAPNPAHVSLVDILPTLCAAADVPAPRGVQGRDLSALLAGRDEPQRYSSILVEQGFGGSPYVGGEPLDPRQDGFTPAADPQSRGAYDELNSRTQSGTTRAVRAGEWKIVAANDGSRALYHLPSDPRELRNRWNDPDCSAVRTRMQDLLIGWLLQVQDVLPSPVRRYVPKREERICP